MVLSSAVGLHLVAPSIVLRVGEILISSGKLQVHMTPVSTLFCHSLSTVFGFSKYLGCSFFFSFFQAYAFILINKNFVYSVFSCVR